MEDALASLGGEWPAIRGPIYRRDLHGVHLPLRGRHRPGHLLRVVRAFKAMGISDIGLADTLGTTRRTSSWRAWTTSARPSPT